jgi:hypothetical protein
VASPGEQACRVTGAGRLPVPAAACQPRLAALRDGVIVAAPQSAITQSQVASDTRLRSRGSGDAPRLRHRGKGQAG